MPQKTPKKVQRKSRISRPVRPSTWNSLKELWSKRPAYLAPLLAGLMVLAVALYVTGTQLEQHDNFCASCHTQPEDDFYTRSLESTAQDLAAFHAQKGVLCIQCHAGKGVFGRFMGLMAGAQDLVAFYSGHYPQPATLEEPMPDSHCTRCHAEVFNKLDFNNHFHVYLRQWQAVDPSAAKCTTCHTTHSTDGPTDQMFLINTTVTQTCQRCHNSISR